MSRPRRLAITLCVFGFVSACGSESETVVSETGGALQISNSTTDNVSDDYANEGNVTGYTSVQYSRDLEKECHAVNQDSPGPVNHKECSGFWNIYASIGSGEKWWYDKMHVEPSVQRIQKAADEIQTKLKECGIVTHISLSNFFDNFSPDLVVVHSNPFTSSRDASQDLRTARSCGLDGYTKKSNYQLIH